ncbi:MAG: MarR family winged helix-turn-helix transcriptional regulator [Telluria sp.]
MHLSSALAPPTGCTSARLRKLARATSRMYDRHLAAIGLKTTQYSVLKNAAEQGGLPVAELAGVLAMDRTTLTRNLKPLIDAGWIALAPGADARQRIVTVTPAGKAKVGEARRVWRRAQDELESILGQDTVAVLHAQLDAALAALTPYLEDLPHANADD